MIQETTCCNPEAARVVGLTVVQQGLGDAIQQRYSRRMARIEPDALADPEQVYLVATLGEARRIEALLTARGVDHATQVEVLGRTTLFGSLRHGAGFYVSATQAEYCRHALAQAGFSRGIIHDAEGAGE